MKWDCARCNTGKTKFGVYDARGIFCAYACADCEASVRARYRLEVLTDANYETDEPIEGES